MELYERIPNNVNLSEDKRLQRALERWLPNYLDWWREMGPEGFQEKDVWLRTAISVEPDGWANFDYVRMPEYRWAMVYLLHGYFGRDGRDEADALLERRSGNPDKPRILEAFNQPCDDWLNFFCFTMFTDRDGKYQLSALAESGFEPLARTCQF